MEIILIISQTCKNPKFGVAILIASPQRGQSGQCHSVHAEYGRVRPASAEELVETKKGAPKAPYRNWLGLTINQDR